VLKARIAAEPVKTAGQSFKKSVIIEGFADRSEVGKTGRRNAGRFCGFVKNIQPISVGV